MSTGTIMDSKSSVLSVEEEVGFDEELGEPITLGEMLGSQQEDRSFIASKKIDWEKFFATHDVRYGIIVRGMAEGKNLKDTVKGTKHRNHYSGIFQLKPQLARDLQEFLGEDAIADSLEAPHWKASLKASSERAACVPDRRRW
jgi:hypothetical protein